MEDANLSLAAVLEAAAPADLEEHEGDPREVVLYTTGFTGKLIFFDTVMYYATWGFHILVVIFFFLGKAKIWGGTLSFILVVFALDTVVLKCRGQDVRMRDRSIRRFMHGIPLAFFCFYSHSIIHKTGECRWFIEVENDNLRTLTQDGTYVAGLVVLLSMALTALRMDCNCSASVSGRVRDSRWYALCHLLFRFSEWSFRLGMGILLSECLRVLPWSAEVGPPLFLCVPFLCLVLFYAVVLQVPNQWGGKPMDDAIPCIADGIVTLAMNPMHFFARPGYDAAVERVNKLLFLIRFVEVVAAVGFLYRGAGMTAPGHVCNEEVTGLHLLQRLGQAAVWQVVIPLAVHYLIMALHTEIQHSTCQALAGGGAAPHARPHVAFLRRGQQERSLYVRPPLADTAGLGRAWFQLGGGVPLLALAQQRPAAEVEDRYSITRLLGDGAFGVVLRVEAQDPGAGASRPRAMKLLNTGDGGPARSCCRRCLPDSPEQRLADREVAIYSRVWLSVHELAPGYFREGHPNIVRLHFWSVFPQGLEFRMAGERGGEATVQHPKTGITRFHVALMMELCETNLKIYLRRHHANTARWFELAVHFLAEIQLALEFLHETMSVTYRDLKPENVLIVTRPGGNPALPAVHCKLGDFGYGRVVDPQADPLGASVAGTPYFCAPEMEERVRHRAFHATPKEMKALDVYSYGTVAYTLAKGPECITAGRSMGRRTDHPRCWRLGQAGRCQECVSCQLLQQLREQMPFDQDGHLVDLIGRCVAMRAAERPAVAALRTHGLFQEVDFDALVRQDL